MLVPRSFKYSSSPKDSPLRERPGRRAVHARSVIPTPSEPPPPSKSLVPPLTRPRSPPPPSRTTSTAPVAIPSSRNSNAPAVTSDTSPGDSHSMPSFKSATEGRRRRKASATHDPNALPPAVAALLAMTTIPPRRPNRYRKKSSGYERVSIDQLVNEWKSEDSLKSTYSSGPVLGILLEDPDVLEEVDFYRAGSVAEDTYLNARSHSSESMPELEADDRSVFSVGSPSTPGSLRSRRSYSNLKREKARSLPVEDCALNHPLVALPEPDSDSEDALPLQKVPTPSSKPRSSFTSNLTTSLQTLKNAAINSISSLGRSTNNASTPLRRGSNAPHYDTMLWSHPYLFPHFSSEVRPITTTSTDVQRRYLNPMPLTFEEQEAPFQLALHAPYLAEERQAASAIQMQTYTRRTPSRRRPVRRGGGGGTNVDPTSEAGRALLGAAEGARPREVRENCAFLRVVVLEMNMRREGKLENSGRAKIWLPPREGTTNVSAGAGSASQQRPQGVRLVPARWVGVSAY